MTQSPQPTGGPALSLEGGVVAEAFDVLIEDLVAAVPRVVAGLLFVLVAYVLVRVIQSVLRRILSRVVPGQSPLYRQFVGTLVSVFLWFAVGLAFLSIVGLDGIAASLGTATGFIALGVSFALSDAIADVVAGVYLLEDPDFNVGDEVTVGDMSGEVTAIELRKTRFAVDGDTIVRANADIEKRWRKAGAPAE
jgi:small-conductance mechanosensitive channel